MATIARLVAYWLVVLSALWGIAFLFACGTEAGMKWYQAGVSDTLMKEHYKLDGDIGSVYITLIKPLILAGAICLLLVTNTPLPMTRTSWIFKPIRYLRQLGGSKMNQFGMGDFDFNVLALCLVVFPIIGYFTEYGEIMELEDADKARKFKAMANYFGRAGVISLSFFLIPVARHNILLAALGWSPIHALRIHIWSGYLSFGLISLHSVLCLANAFVFGEGSIIDQFIPDSNCWGWIQTEPLTPKCTREWFNFTGAVTFLFFFALVATSINWFRRRHYRQFYIYHMTFAALMLLGAAIHWKPLALYVAPSLVYYLASTMPVLVQGVASRLRGGVQIASVVHLDDAGGCVEVRVAASPKAISRLDKEVCMFVKICVPNISLVWHPFTIFKHPTDSSTVRLLFKPVGPFTRTLATRLSESPPPITVMDGFYRGGDRLNEALSHDHVTLVCGGVAITPFLSIIPGLLQALRRRESCGVKKLELHWACRDNGLAAFVTNNYLDAFSQMATELTRSSCFEFRVFIYHTATEKEWSTSRTDMTFQSIASEVEVTDYDNSVDEEVPIDERDASHSIVSQDIVREVGATQQRKTSAEGHAMELATFMPALNSKIWQNLPQFLAMGASLLFGFFVLHHCYNDNTVKVHPIVARFWGVVVWLLTSLGLGLCFEICNASGVLDGFSFSETHLEEPKESSSPSSSSSYCCVDLDAAGIDVEHIFRRPCALDIFQGLDNSDRPGIFMCGPAALTDMVKAEANKENSCCGLTRFALYEEPFEM